MSDFFDHDHDADANDADDFEPSAAVRDQASDLTAGVSTNQAAATQRRRLVSTRVAFERELPEPAEWSAAAVRLLQGVVYHDEMCRSGIRCCDRYHRSQITSAS